MNIGFMSGEQYGKSDWRENQFCTLSGYFG